MLKNKVHRTENKQITKYREQTICPLSFVLCALLVLCSLFSVLLLLPSIARAAYFPMETGSVAPTGDWDFGGGTLQVPNSANLPASCEVGDVYVDSDATSGSMFYVCETANSWVAQGSGGSASLRYDQIGDAGTNAGLVFSTFTNSWTSSATTGDFFDITATSLTTGDAATINVGTSTTGDALEINRGGTNVAGIDGFGQLRVGSFGGTVNGDSSINFSTFGNSWTSSATTGNFFNITANSMTSGNAATIAVDSDNMTTGHALQVLGGASSTTPLLVVGDIGSRAVGIGTSAPAGTNGVGNNLSADMLLDIDLPGWGASDDVQLRVGDIVLTSRNGGGNQIGAETSRSSNGNLNLDAEANIRLQPQGSVFLDLGGNINQAQFSLRGNEGVFNFSGQVTARSWGGTSTGHSGIDFATFTNTWTSSAGDARFFQVETATTDVVIRGDGNVGIGTTDPGAVLAVVGTPQFSSFTNCNLDTDGSGNLVCGTDGGGTAPRWDEILDPGTHAGMVFGDFTNSWTFTGGTNLWTSTLDGGDFFRISNTDADLAADTRLLTLTTTDDGDSNAIFLEAKDHNGADTKFIIKGDNVGIGVSDPDYALEIGGALGNLKLSDAGLTQPILTTESTDTYFVIAEAIDNIGGAFISGYSDNGAIQGVTLNGYVGGTTPTVAAISVKGYKEGAAGAAANLFSGEKVIEILNGSSANGITLLGSGNVGINTATPGSTLTVVGQISGKSWTGISDRASGIDFSTFANSWTSSATTGDFFDITASSLTTGDAVNVNVASSNTTGDAIEINRGGTKVAGIDGFGQLSVGSFGGTVNGDSGIDFLTRTNTWTSSAGDARFFQVETATTDVVIRGDGNVGIGNTDPISLVHVDGGATFGQVTIDGATGGCLMMRDTDDAGWTECDALDGVLTCSIDADGICD